MDAADEASLNPRERELLAYLEDLQANNPAEYELLMKEMQEKQIGQGGAAGAGGTGAANSQGVTVTPTPGFVAKTRSATKQGQKVFINICQSEHVDQPAPMAQADNSDEVQMRIPLSLGPPREDLDKSGDVCTVYDVVFHPDTVENSLKDEDFRSFVMQLILYQIEQKHKEELSQDITFPKVKGNYKGIAPLPQFMRKKGVSPPSQSGTTTASDATEADSSSGGSEARPLVEEVAAPPTEKLPAPCYSVEPRHLGKHTGGAADGLSIKAHLPDVHDASVIELGVHSEAIELLVPSVCALSLQLPSPAVLPPLSVKFETERRILTVLLRVDAASALDGGVRNGDAGEDSDADGLVNPTGGREAGSEGDAAGWSARLEREREARVNARRRRAAGNKQLQRQAEAAGTAGDAIKAADATSGVVVESEPGAREAADGKLDEASATAASAIVPASAPAPAAAVLMGMTNSIMFELED